MIDKTEIECRFRRSVDSYEDNATVQKWIVQRLVELLQEYVPYSSRTLEIGCGTGLLSEKINRLWEDQQFWVNDLVEQMCRKTIDRCQLPVSHGLNGDIEQIPLTGKFDLIVSASTFQWLAHPRATFAKYSFIFTSDGISSVDVLSLYIIHFSFSLRENAFFPITLTLSGRIILKN